MPLKQLCRLIRQTNNATLELNNFEKHRMKSKPSPSYLQLLKMLGSLYYYQTLVFILNFYIIL